MGQAAEAACPQGKENSSKSDTGVERESIA